MKELKITLVHSTIGSKPVHRKNVEALGLNKLGQEVIRQEIGRASCRERV